MGTMHAFALFDADSRELDESGTGLSLRPRMAPIAPRLVRLYRWAEARRLPLVFTTCCSGRMLSKDSLGDTVFVPLEPVPERWWDAALGARRFYLAKRAYGDPQKNFACRAFDMFADNRNVARLVTAIGAETWVVFGNAFDLCVASAARGLLDAGQQIVVLEDVWVSSARGTATSERAALATLRDGGARVLTLEALLREAS